MEYTIKNNTEYNSIEIYFNGIPEANIRNGLKNLKMRWNPKKLCWYGYTTAEKIAAIMEGKQPAAAEEKKPALIADYSNIFRRLDFEEFKIKSSWRPYWSHTYSNKKDIVIDAAFIERRAKEDYKKHYLYELSDGLLIEIDRPEIEGTLYYDDETEAPATTESSLIRYNLQYHKKAIKIEYKSELENNFYLIRNGGRNENQAFIYYNKRGEYDLQFKGYENAGLIIRRATAEEIKALLTEYAKINIDYIKRIKAYYKRYGCTTYGYWANR